MFYNYFSNQLRGNDMVWRVLSLPKRTIASFVNYESQTKSFLHNVFFTKLKNEYKFKIKKSKI